MVYITTTKFLGSLPIISEVKESETSSVLLFYKENDTVKLSEIANLIVNKNVDIELVEVSDRDDMLIVLGGWFVNHDDNVMLLDSTIPVPKRYADRIKTGAVTKSTRTRRKSVKKDKDVVNKDTFKDDGEFDKGVDLIAGKTNISTDNVSKDVVAKATRFDVGTNISSEVKDVTDVKNA